MKAEHYVSLFPLRQEQVQGSLRALDAKDGQPCIGCKLSAACADMNLACHPYRRWVHGRLTFGKREPTRTIYEGVFREDDL